MRIEVGSPVSFGYSNILKTEWRKGHLPSVKYGFYGEKLTQKNLSLEHLQVHSKGGKTILSNLVLAAKETNNKRGCEDIRNFADRKNVLKYLIQFMGIRTKRFDGDAYIGMILKTLEGLGVKL